MKEYYELKLKLKQKEFEFNKQLNEVLTENKIVTSDAWFNFNESYLTIVLNQSKLSMKLLSDLEKKFSKVECVYSNPISNKLFVKFEYNGDEQ